MGGVLPRGIADDRLTGKIEIEKQARLAAGVVGKSGFPEMPEQDGKRVFAGLQVRREVDDITIGGVRCRPSFQTALSHHQRSVEPQPVFGVGGNCGLCLSWDFCEAECLAEPQPLVGGALRGTDPRGGGFTAGQGRKG